MQLKRSRGAALQGYALAATLVFGVLAFFARRRTFMAEDIRITRTVKRFRAPWMEALMLIPSAFGFKPERYLFSGFITIALFAAGESWDGLVAALTILSDTLAVNLLKNLIDEPRPTQDEGIEVMRQHHTPGFPSWHVVFITAFYGFLWYMSYSELPRSRSRTLALGGLGGLIGLIGISRVYRGAHFPSEVLGGYVLGSLFLAEEIYLHDWGKPRFER